jgi:hypothetical protein
MQAVAVQVGIPYDIMNDGLRRAGELALAAEIARTKVIKGEPGTSIETLSKIENLAERALHRLHVRERAKAGRQPDPWHAELLSQAGAEP